MKAALATLAVAAALAAAPSHALDVFPLDEAAGPAAVGGPCALSLSTNGTSANFRWYNICSGYLWIYNQWEAGEGVGVRFGGPLQLAVNDNNDVKRVITYYRNVTVNYQQLVDIYLDRDNQGDGCPDGVLASDLGLDPGLRWNCSDFNVSIPAGVNYVIVRQVHRGGDGPSFATDRRKITGSCPPIDTPRSFYYGVDGAVCMPWDGPTARNDNFLTWLILDGLPNPPPHACCLPSGACEDLEPGLCLSRGGAIQPIGTICETTNCSPTPVPLPAIEDATWGRVKGLFR